MMRRSLILAVVLVGAACSSGSAAPRIGQTVVIDGQRVTVHGATDVGGQTSEDVDVAEFRFDPTVLTGSGGQTITLTLHNRGTLLHNFSIPQQQIDRDVSPGQSITVTVTFPAYGALPFFCRYHRSRGMLGALEAG